MDTIHAGLIKSDELIYDYKNVCVQGRVCLFTVGGRQSDGKGREGQVFGSVSFFHLKIRASPENPGKPN